MRFHLPSFLHYCKQGLPQDVGFYHHHYVCYVLSAYPLRLDFLQDVVGRAVIDSFEAPLGTPDETEARSLIEGLLDAHAGKLLETLLSEKTYLAEYRHSPGTIATERPRFEYRIDIKIIQGIVHNICLTCDIELMKELIRGDYFVSVRGMEQKIMQHVGKAYSKRRINDILRILEHDGVIKNNGKIKTYGREVLT